MDEKKKRIEKLVARLNRASNAYYGGREEQMTNFEWDALFDELLELENETQYILPESPTQTTSHAEEDQNNGVKESHEYPALSLAKTKSIRSLQEWAGNRAVWLSWKLDGLTLVLTYDGGVLTKILTRGNGSVGTNITFMKDALLGFPTKLDYPGHLVVRGEATISYSDFEAINDTLDDADDKYANPRNLASGTLALDASRLDKVRERHVTFNAFTLVYIEMSIISWGERMDFLDRQGFTTVEREKTDAAALPEAVERWTQKVDSGQMGIPVDGLVITYDDTGYAATGSITGHHAVRAGLAYKWKDMSALSVLRHIEWSCAASIITPVAVFDPVQLEGTTVSRASLCNISELERLGIGGEGETTLEVIKANKIIPKCIAVKKASGHFEIPDMCPVCHAKTEIRVSAASGTKTLRCTNPACPAKHLKRFARFVSKTGMDIDGLSIQSLLAFVNKGFIRTYADIYGLSDYADEIAEMPGFGEKSCENLMRSIEKSRRVQPANFIFALCIPLIGLDAGKKIIAALGTDGFFERLTNGTGFEDIDGIGPEKSNAITAWFEERENREAVLELLNRVTVENVPPTYRTDGRCMDLTFVITGDVHMFANRDAFKTYVEGEGGHVAGSVSKKTDYLVNNDLASASAKNEKAKALGIPILSEAAFLEKFGDPGKLQNGEIEQRG